MNMNMNMSMGFVSLNMILVSSMVLLWGVELGLVPGLEVVLYL